MLTLITKDLLVNKKSIGLILLLYLLFFTVKFPADFYLCMGIYLLASQCVYLEEKNKTIILLKTMPFKDVTVVLSKYLFMLIVAVIFIIFKTIINEVFKCLSFSSMAEFIITASIVLLLMGIFFMLYYKFGTMKAGILISVIIITLIFLYIFSLVDPVKMEMMILQDQTGILKIINSLILAISQIPLTWINLVLTELIILGMYFVTSIFSIRFYRKDANF